MPDSTLDQGDLARLSEAASQGELRGGHRCDGAIRVLVDGERVYLGENIPNADAAYWSALANAHRAGNLIWHGTPAPLAAPGVREAVEALRPFAAWITKLDGEFADHADDVIAGGLQSASITFGDLRRARAALARLDPAARGAETRAGSETFPQGAGTGTYFRRLPDDTWIMLNSSDQWVTIPAPHWENPAAPTVRRVEVPAGYRLVPVEPTEGMARASHLTTMCSCGSRIHQWGVNAWSAKLAAAPSEPETGTGGGWQPIETAPVGVEILVRGGRSVFSPEQRGTGVTIIDDLADLYRPDGTLSPRSPTMWHPVPEHSSITPRPAETRGPSDGDGSQSATVASTVRGEAV